MYIKYTTQFFNMYAFIAGVIKATAFECYIISVSRRVEYLALLATLTVVLLYADHSNKLYDYFNSCIML